MLPERFHVKLGIVTKEKCNMLPMPVNNELCVCHRGGKLVGALTKHVDDVKIIGDRLWIEWLVKQLEAVFGSLN